MRCLLDTCIMLYMLNKTGEMSDDVEAIVSDYGNRPSLMLNANSHPSSSEAPRKGTIFNSPVTIISLQFKQNLNFR